MKRKSKDDSVQKSKVSRSSEEPWVVKSGMIMEVNLKNFMCHEKFQFVPNQRLNFLVGENGSGKSAILTAISFVLGSNAKSTNRGNSNKNFIRSGQSSATVEIRLCNTGMNKYQEDVFGDSVIVSRTVTETSSTYKLKDCRGKVVYDKKVKEELEKLLEYYGIQIDNPMTVLDQDQSKTFLSKSDSKQLYRLFHRSTLLKNVEDDYFQAERNLDISRDLWNRKGESISTLKEEFKKWKKKKEFLASMKDQEDDIHKLKTELAWSAVRDAETKLDDIKKNKERELKKSNMAEQTVEQHKVKDKEARKKKAEVEEKIQSLAANHEDKSSKTKIAKTVYDDKGRDVARMEREVKEMKNKKKKTEAEIKIIIEAIESARKSSKEFEEKHAARKNKIQELEAEVDAMKAQKEASNNHFIHLKNNMRDVDNDLSYMRQQGNSVNVKLDGIEREVRELETGEKNKLAAFGNWMPRLVKEIERCASKFSKMPIGPLGAHFTINDGVPDNVITIIEGELGALSHAFRCNNSNDQRVLFDIFTKLRIPVKPTIVTSEFSDHKYDIESARVRSKYITLIDCIDTADPTVFNTLVDEVNLEKIIVIDSSTEAQKILAKIESVPGNLKYAVVENKYQYFPAPNYKSYFKKYTPKNLLKASLEEVIQEKKNEAARLRVEKQEHENRMKENQVKYKEAEQLVKQEDSKIRTIGSKISNKQKIIETLKNEEYAEESPDIVALEEDEAEYKNRDEKQAKELEAKKLELMTAKQGEVEAKTSYEEAEEEFNKSVEQIGPLKQELTNREDQIKKINRDMEHYINKKKEYLEKAESFNPSIKDQEVEIEKAIERAGVYCTQRCDTIRAVDKIKQDLMKTRSKLDKMTDNVEPKNVIMENFALYHEKFSNKKTELENLRQMLTELFNSLQTRKSGYYNILRQTAKAVQRNFTMQLEHRNFLGMLHFEHTERTLVVKVNPHDTKNAGLDVDRDLKSLSGGEKSYTLISFILSLWQVMAPPFRILDEFDVFMDAVNRRISVTNIINFSKKDRSNQFIFLTPLGTQNIVVDNDVKIIRLEKLQNH